MCLNVRLNFFSRRSRIPICFIKIHYIMTVEEEQIFHYKSTLAYTRNGTGVLEAGIITLICLSGLIVVVVLSSGA